MSTVLDSFNRANGALGTSDSGQNWSVLTGTSVISGNAAVVTAGAPSATAALPFGDHTTGDFSLKVSVSSGAANPAGLLVRVLDNNNRVGCFLGISNQRASIFKTDGGTTTELAFAAFTIAASTVYTVRAVLTGALIDMYVNGVLVVSFTLTGGDETQYTAANGYTKVGFRGDTTATFDDLVDEVTVTPPAGPGVAFLPDELGADARLVVEAAWGADLAADPSTWDWSDITTDVRQDPGISTTLGRGDEASTSQPANLQLLLANSAGAYSLGGESVNWPYVRQGTPIRVTIDPDDGDGDRTVLLAFAVNWTPGWDALTGQIPVVQLTAAGTLRRLEQGQAPVFSALRRSLNDTSSVVAYWPMEDGKDSTLLRADVGGQDMTYTGSPKLGTAATFNCSADIVDVGTGAFTANVPNYTAGTESQVRMLITVPEDGLADGAVLAYVWTSGTIIRWDIVYSLTGTGNLGIFVYNADGTLNDSNSPITFDMNGKDRRLSLELTQNGANIDYTIGVIQPQDLGAGLFSDTITGKTFGRVTQVQLAPLAQCSGTLIGHLSVQNDVTALFEASGALRAHVGELASSSNLAISRLNRLADENAVQVERYTAGGLQTEADRMGPQLPAQLLTLLRECETADQGQLWDGRTAGLSYTTRRYRENPSLTSPPVSNPDGYTPDGGPRLTIDVGAGELAPGFGPTHDDQRLRNKVTATRLQGVTATVEDITGPRGTDPATGIGIYDSSLTVNSMQDLMAEQHAGWQVALGTGEDYRVPSVTIDLRAHPSLAGTLLNLIPGDRVDLVDVDDAFLGWGASRALVQLIVEGIAHQIAGPTWRATLACSPFSPWGVAEVADEASDTGELVWHLDTDGSTLGASRTAGQTSLSVATASGPLWTTTADDYPFYLAVGGVKVRATACTGTSSPQTMTVDALSVARAAGVPIALWDPRPLGL